MTLSKASQLMALAVKPFEVTVSGYGSGTYYAASRGKALAEAWRCDAFLHLPFGGFLKIATARKATPQERFGEQITVGGQPAFLISWNRQYIQFARPGSDAVLSTHPLDVEPPEARRGTAYHVPAHALLDKEPQE